MAPSIGVRDSGVSNGGGCARGARDAMAASLQLICGDSGEREREREREMLPQRLCVSSAASVRGFLACGGPQEEEAAVHRQDLQVRGTGGGGREALLTIKGPGDTTVGA